MNQGSDSPVKTYIIIGNQLINKDRKEPRQS